MPSFLTKVFSRRRNSEKGGVSGAAATGVGSGNVRTSVFRDSSLEGGFEAVSPTVSPTAAKFMDNDVKLPPPQSKLGSGGGGISLIRSRSRQKATSTGPDKGVESTTAFPLLTLNLDLSPTKAEENGGSQFNAVFEASGDDGVFMDENALAEKRLSPLEAFSLIKACTQIINARGLDTLGIMHPNWPSASPALQRKIISLFILSLSSKAPITPLTPSPAAASAAFDSELRYSRTAQDVASVFRWGLRHLKLENDSFGKDTTPYGWYDKFAEAERNQSYPPKAFTELLVPQVPQSHVQLLLATLDTISVLAASSEMNGESGSKLSMFLGFYLFNTRKALASLDNWNAFYSHWERTGRMLEHIFLSYIRDQAVNAKIPTRLLELVKLYPYSKQISGDDTSLFPRPRFASRNYDALYIRVTTEIGRGETKPKDQHPVRIVGCALKSTTKGTTKYEALWQEIQKKCTIPVAENGTANGDGNAKPDAKDRSQTTERMGLIFSDETVRLLHLRPTDKLEAGPVAKMFGTPNWTPRRRRSSSVGATPKGNGRAGRSVTMYDTMKDMSKVSGLRQFDSAPASSSMIPDWNFFSKSGFGEAAGKSLASTLFETETNKKAAPPPVPRKSSKRRKPSPDSGRRSSVDNAPSSLPAGPSKAGESFLTNSALVQIDEAFVDFWSDTLLDPITGSWPAFVICQLKEPMGQEPNQVGWLVIEQAFSVPEVPLTPASPTSNRAASPKPSFRSDMSGDRRLSRVSATFSTRRRFPFFGTGSHESVVIEPKVAPSLKSPLPQVGELGEIITEKVEPRPTQPQPQTHTPIIPMPTPVTQLRSPPPKKVEADPIISPITPPTVLKSVFAGSPPKASGGANSAHLSAVKEEKEPRPVSVVAVATPKSTTPPPANDRTTVTAAVAVVNTPPTQGADLDAAPLTPAPASIINVSQDTPTPPFPLDHVDANRVDPTSAGTTEPSAPAPVSTATAPTTSGLDADVDAEVAEPRGNGHTNGNAGSSLDSPDDTALESKTLGLGDIVADETQQPRVDEQ